MIRRDFVKRLSALAALPILPAFLRRNPPDDVTYYSWAIGPTFAEVADSGDLQRLTYHSEPGDPLFQVRMSEMWWTTDSAKGRVTRKYELVGDDWRLVSVRHA